MFLHTTVGTQLAYLSKKKKKKLKSLNYNHYYIQFIILDGKLTELHPL